MSTGGFVPGSVGCLELFLNTHGSHDLARWTCLALSELHPVLFLLQISMPAIMTMLADHAAQQLLDFNQKLDINLLDNVVNCLYHGVGPQVG